MIFIKVSSGGTRARGARRSRSGLFYLVRRHQFLEANRQLNEPPNGLRPRRQVWLLATPVIHELEELLRDPHLEHPILCVSHVHHIANVLTPHNRYCNDTMYKPGEMVQI